MLMAGGYVGEEILGNLIALIATHEDLHGYAVSKMYVALLKESRQRNQQSLVQVGVWCIGEYGDVLVANNNSDLKIEESGVLDLLDGLLKDPVSDAKTKEYVLTALIKLSHRFSNNSQARLKNLISGFSSSLNVELQQRACEFLELISRSDSAQLKSTVLEHIPPPEIENNYDDNSSSTSTSGSHSLLGGDMMGNGTSSSSGSVSLLGGLSSSTSTSSSSTSTSTGGGGGGSTNIIDEIFGGAIPSSSTSSSSSSTTNSLLSILSGSSSTPPSSNNALAGLGFGNLLDTPVQGPVPVPGPVVGGSVSYPVTNVFSKNGVNVTFDFVKPDVNGKVIAITASFSNENPQPVTNFTFLVAVPKYIVLNMQSPSSNVLPPSGSGTVTQKLTLENTMQGSQPLAVRIRVQYEIGGSKVEELATISKFPAGL
eukprot:TRINITY_DN3910_c0_g2_i1.p1 TRINITY_DN3910_c0_g2~~TRINITY_DN3910_c0_g2_i1.p1  ORF type:complete len:426 (-),score=159.37 TRINITY_DN3910_c0_g2_i1:55-1332(-)